MRRFARVVRSGWRELRRALRGEGRRPPEGSGPYPCLEHFSSLIGIPGEALARAFEIERVFHQRILEENDFERRQALYQDVYQTVHPIYGSVPSDEEFRGDHNPRAQTIWLFTPELAGKSILDVGCGRGEFLVGVARSLPHGRLLGIDAVVPPSDPALGVSFRADSIVRFDLGERFDVAFSDNVIEHIAPADLDTHLGSIRGALREGGILIVLTPNRIFGPWDVTRILDDHYSGRIPAQGTHLNEMTHVELAAALRRNGFHRLRTVLPVSKVSRRMGRVRVPFAIPALGERVPGLTHFARGVADKWRYLGAFEISVIARRKG
jgi:2-polyprenyl-3-methyl-5-hydroxy-6-metoxy-1,4-benzoquinol methylase